MNTNKQQVYSPYLDSRNKRFLDITVSLILLLPALLVIAALAVIIVITDGPPAFFTQKRVGKKLKLFEMTKLRTLKTTADPYMPSYTSNLSQYLIPLGKFLRKYRLDELPQFFSVLKGHMSLVGPRPELPREVKEYSERAKKRFLVKPGVTGLWQINAERNKPMHSNQEYDLCYLRRADLKTDLSILIKTVFFILKKSQYENRIYSYKIPCAY